MSSPTRFSKRIRYLETYFSIALSLYPEELSKVTKVYIVPTPLDKRMGHFGLCQSWNNGTYSIGVAVKYQSIVFKEKYVDVKRKSFSIIDILETFAHELAHVIQDFPTHTIEHKRVEHRIMGRFLTRMKKEGYTSEEDEVKNGFVHKVLDK